MDNNMTQNPPQGTVQDSPQEVMDTGASGPDGAFAQPGTDQFQPDYRYMPEIDYNLSQKKISPAKKALWNIFLLIEGLAAVGVAGLFAVFGFMSMIPTPFLLSAAFGWFGISDIIRLIKKNYPESFIKTLLFTAGFTLAALIVLARPVNFKSGSESHYFMHSRYAEMITDSENFFPDEIPEDLEDYGIRIKKKAFGKSTWASVCYQLDRDFSRERDWDKLDDMLYSNSFSLLNKDRPVKLSNISDLEKRGIYVKYDEDFWFGFEDQAYVIVKQSSGNRSEPESRAIIICPEKGMIEYSVLDD